MKALRFYIFLLAALSLITAPALAKSQGGRIANSGSNKSGFHKNTMEDKLDKWVKYVEDLGYEVIDSTINSIRYSDTISYDLKPGTYHAYAEGSSNIRDLNMSATDERGNQLDSDTEDDNTPAISFKIRKSQTVEFDIEVVSFRGLTWPAKYCFVLARETGDRKHDDHGKIFDDDRNGHSRYDDRFWRTREVDDRGWDQTNGLYGHQTEFIRGRLDDLLDQADAENLDPVMRRMGQIAESASFDPVLPAGEYKLFLAGGENIRDLDAEVSDNEGWSITRDYSSDASPTLEFTLDKRQRVKIDVKVWSFKGWESSDYYCLVLCRK
jgi:hypothetical protein